MSSVWQALFKVLYINWILFNCCSLPVNCSFHFYFCFTEEAASVLQLLKFSETLEFINGGGGVLK